MLDRYLLRYFLAVVDHGNFSRAAQACNVAQPTLSIGIAKLERLVGHALFVRSNQRVELTDAGNRLLGSARRIEREFNAVVQDMAAPEEAPALRLGVLGSIPTAAIAAAVARTAPAEHRRLEIVFGSERELVGHLAKARVDVALTLVGRGADRFAERVLLTEGYALALSDRHPLASRNRIAPEELAGETMIVRRQCEALSETSRFFTERGVRPHFALRSTDDDRVLQMVAAGLGLTVMPATAAHPGVARPQLAGFTATRSIGWAAAHHAEHLIAAPTAFLQAIERNLSAAAPGVSPS